MSFTSLALHPSLNSLVAQAGYTEPTPIQKQAIPVVLKGKDVLGLAQTGTGKTAAFVLPMVHRLLERQGRGVRALIIAPTRELVDQILEVVRTFTKGSRLRSLSLYGGVSVGPQVDGLRRGAEIVVACPGRLLDHLAQRTISLASVETVVFDEADQMFDMGFLPNIRRIATFLPKNRQTLLFSATMPQEIRRLTEELLGDYDRVEVDRIAPATSVSHALYPVALSRKVDLLFAILPTIDVDSMIIFTRTKQGAKRLTVKLIDAGYKATCLQGNLSQNRRKEAMEGFRSGAYRILVATDIAARGIDIRSVTHVVNYDVPDTTEAYTHRIGRTGRAAATGDAYTFITPEDTAMVRSIEKALGYSVRRAQVAGFDSTVAVAGKDPLNQPVPKGMRGGGRGGSRPNGGGHGGPQQRSGQGGGQRRGGGSGQAGGGRPPQRRPVQTNSGSNGVRTSSMHRTPRPAQ